MEWVGSVLHDTTWDGTRWVPAEWKGDGRMLHDPLASSHSRAPTLLNAHRQLLQQSAHIAQHIWMARAGASTHSTVTQHNTVEPLTV